MADETPEITYAEWYPDVLPVMNSAQLAELLTTSEQQIRIWAQEGIVPAHRPARGRKFTFLRHEIFTWLVENRYAPSDVAGDT